jgi:hypothetical protein
VARAPKKRPLTERERQERFVAMAREVEASEDPQDFDRAFQRIAMPPPKPKADGGG